MKILKNKKYNILSNILKYGFVIVFSFILISNMALAVCPDGTDSSPCPDGTDDGTGITIDIKNPLGEDGPQNIPDFIKKLVEIVLYVGIPIIALAIIYTGFLFVKAQGNSEELTRAKKALLYTLIGGALLLGAFVIAQAIGSTVDEIKKGV